MPRGPYLTVAEKAEIWTRRVAGEPIWVIARDMGRSRKTVHAQVVATGGVRPRTPQRSRRELTAGEREELSRGLGVGDSCRAMAKRMGSAPSSVSREVSRGGGRGD